jgi:ABC-2 type transport system permease protein
MGAKLLAFIKRDLKIQLSYPLNFFLSWLTPGFYLVIFYILSQMVGHGVKTHLSEYQSDYFAFAVVGMACSFFLFISLKSFATSIRQEQMMGTLEAMLLTPTPLSLLLLGLTLYSFIAAALYGTVFLLAGVYIFGLNLSALNLDATLVILALTLICLSCIGIISSGFVMIFKLGDPVEAFINIFSMIFGGVYFPITLMPKSLQAISAFIPLTYSLRAMRHTMLQGYSLALVKDDLLMLLLFIAILLPVSLMWFSFAVRYSKNHGSLLHY